MVLFARAFAGRSRFAAGFSAFGALLAIGLLVGCQSEKEARPSLPAAPGYPSGPVATHPLTNDEPDFLRLGNTNRDRVPARVGILLPFTNASSATRALASSMLKSAEMAVFESGNPDLLLISADEGSTPETAAAGARTLLQEGAEIIVGPLFGPSTTAVAPLARDSGVPVISFSTDRRVAGQGVYLLSFLPRGEVRRVIAFAASEGHRNFAALVPVSGYGERVGEDFKDDVKAMGGTVTDVEKFTPSVQGVIAPAHAAALTKPDAILIAQGGPLLRDIASALASAGAGPEQVKYLGTGLWDDPVTAHNPLLAGGYFAAPSPAIDQAFVTKYKNAYGTTPPQLSSLAYDAVSLVALLTPGKPYNRFTAQTISDPNGFSGVDGIFRFLPDGTAERGLAVITINSDGTFSVASPAPTTFQASGS
ncbi:MAG TPA: penicillin-binding protein activator [Rhizomicrobium sp.]|nr:penicillin-binding protein activator [Rhizomicrobium sp.]